MRIIRGEETATVKEGRISPPTTPPNPPPNQHPPPPRAARVVRRRGRVMGTAGEKLDRCPSRRVPDLREIKLTPGKAMGRGRRRPHGRFSLCDPRLEFGENMEDKIVGTGS